MLNKETAENDPKMVIVAQKVSERQLVLRTPLCILHPLPPVLANLFQRVSDIPGLTTDSTCIMDSVHSMIYFSVLSLGNPHFRRGGDTASLAHQGYFYEKSPSPCFQMTESKGGVFII